MEEYDRKKVEDFCYNKWDGATLGDHPYDYTIDVPPPTVSGILHLGHVYQYIIQDIPARYNKLKNGSTLFPFGYDNNGIATERFVERETGGNRADVEPEEFRSLFDEVVPKREKKYRDRMKQLGVQIDWSEDYRTISDSVRRLSQESFIDLYNKGRLYREETPTIWCPECSTAISQAETESMDKPGHYHRIKFPVKDSEEEFYIETTRPELLPACVSVFVHPDDDRSDQLAGKEADVPLFDHSVPILEDDRVELDEGSGIVMCCTFGDKTDIEWFKSYGLDLRVGINEEGHITNVSEEYDGLTTEKARDRIVENLEDQGYLDEVRSIEHAVDVHGRCDTPTEYRVSDQWYIQILDKKDEYLELADEMDWYPEEMFNRYRNWVNGLQWDWCISRQRAVGINFPVWYCEDCGEDIIADADNLPVVPEEDTAPTDDCPNCNSENIQPETDVLDTWATSSLTPLINSGWSMDSGVENSDCYPMTVRPQGHDIISTWLFYTIVKCYEHTGEPPFKQVLINGHILDENLDKMSASRGNVVRPDDVVDEYSIDAIRYWCTSSSVGSDIPYKEQELESGERLIRKLWNASRLVQNESEMVDERPDDLETVDRWMLNQISEVSEQVDEHLSEYEYSKAMRKLRDSFWNTFCSDYLEVAKLRDETKSLHYTLRKSLRSYITMFAPVLSFTSQYIWSNMFSDDLYEQSWVDISVGLSESDVKQTGNVFNAISAVRKWKSVNGYSPSESLSKVQIVGDIEDVEGLLKEAMSIQEVDVKPQDAVPKEVKINYELAGSRLQGDISTVESDIKSGDYSINEDNVLTTDSGIELKTDEYEIVVSESDDIISKKNVYLLDVTS